ncbi:multidrug and toxin extrusion protein 1-like [Glandiceps talaboti]
MEGTSSQTVVVVNSEKLEPKTKGQFGFSRMEMPDGKISNGTAGDKEDHSIKVMIAVVHREPSACSCCPSCCHLKVPSDWSQEVKELMKLAWPTIVTFLLMMVLSMVSVIFCGHLGNKELGAAGIGQAMVSILGTCMGHGMATACDTLFSQTFGSKNKKRVGLILQQGLIILGLLVFPVWGILLNAEYMLFNFGIDLVIVRNAGIYIKCLLAGIPAIFLFAIFSKYLLSQSIVLPIVVIAAIVNVINVPLHYVLVFPLHQGLRGAAIAQTISQWLQTLALIIYIWLRKLHHPTWPGWSFYCLKDWGMFTRLGVAGIFMVSVEWWALEIGAVLTGAAASIQLDAQAILYQLVIITFMYPFGMGVAASVRVGNALGGGDKDKAKNTAKVAIVCTWIGAAASAVIILSLKSLLGKAFTNDQTIVDLVSSALPIVALFQFFDSSAACCSGIMRGCGLQRLGAFLDAVGYYFLGLPIGIVLIFVAHMGVHGLWWGYTAAGVLHGIIFLIALCRTDWSKLETKAAIRAGTVPKSKYRAVHNPSGSKTSNKIVVNMTYNPKHEESDDKDRLAEDEEDLLKDNEEEIPPAETSQPFHLSASLICRRVTVALLAVGLFVFGIVGSNLLVVPYGDLIMVTSGPLNTTVLSNIITALPTALPNIS